MRRAVYVMKVIDLYQLLNCASECLEAAAGFEPADKGFADLSLSHLGTPPTAIHTSDFETQQLLERATGFEPATPTLARLCSTS